VDRHLPTRKSSTSSVLKNTNATNSGNLMGVIYICDIDLDMKFVFIIVLPIISYFEVNMFIFDMQLEAHLIWRMSIIERPLTKLLQTTLFFDQLKYKVYHNSPRTIKIVGVFSALCIFIICLSCLFCWFRLFHDCRIHGHWGHGY
jgi:hypothetical protein